MKKICFIFILIILPLSFIPALENEKEFNKKSFSYIESSELSPNPVGLGDLSTLKIIFDCEDSRNLEFSLENLPSWAVVWRGPFFKTFTDYSTNNISSTKVRITITFKFTKTGRLFIPPFPIIVNGQKGTTATIPVKVGLYKKGKLIIPLEVEWQAASEAYLGEAIPVFLTVKNQEELSICNKINVDIPSKGFFENAGDIGLITSNKNGNIILYDIPVSAYIFTPTSKGRIIIPAASVNLNGNTGWSNGLEIIAKDIPDKIKKSGAIGNFSVNSFINKQELSIGEDLILTYKISGNGNLNYLKTPIPIVSNLFLVSTKVEDNYKYSTLGYSGTKTIYKTYKAEKTGTGALTIPDFFYLDNKTKKVVCIEQKEYIIALKDLPKIDNSKVSKTSPFKKINVQPLTWKNHYNSYLNYIWLLPGIIFYLLLRFFKNSKLIIISLTIFVSILFFITFYFLPQKSIKEAAPNSLDFYNLAVTEYSKENLSKSLHYLRAAIFLNPLNTDYRKTLKNIENENNLTDSLDASGFLHPDIFYYLLVATFNLLFLSAGCKYLYKKSFFQILIIFFLLFSFSNIAMLGFSSISRTKKTAIVAEKNIAIKKIPKDDASNWIFFEEGTAVKIVDWSNNYFFVKTGIGINGWLKSEYLLLDYPY